MNTMAQSNKYLPHKLKIRYYSVTLYRGGSTVAFVCRRYHISKSSLIRWNKKFDGTIESLQDKSHRPLTKHPNAHTKQEIKWIKDYHRRNPHIFLCKLMASLKQIKDILGTSALSTECIPGLVFLQKILLPKRKVGI